MRLEQATETADVVVPVGAVVGAVVVALLVAAVVSAVVRSVARRHSLALDLLKRARRPMRVSLVLAAVWIAVTVTTDDAPWRAPVEHVLLIAFIVSLAVLAGTLVLVAEDAALSRYPVDVPDNNRARRVRTQITVLRRLAIAVLALCALAGVLVTFPGARAAGASLFASAGLLSVIAGLAAQSTLANVFAGLQLAFTDAIRVDDVVVVEGEWGRIEEITMTYVVVHLWDDRRLIMPSTYFTTTPFQNWTRRAADLLGTVELDLDWSVPVDEMRDELTRLLEASDLWDERVGILQVTDATGGHVRVRVLASAVDAPTLFDLRCYVREELVDWLQRTHPQALPRARVEGSITSGSTTTGSTTPGSTTTATGEADRAAPPRLPGADGEQRPGRPVRERDTLPVDVPGPAAVHPRVGGDEPGEDRPHPAPLPEHEPVTVVMSEVPPGGGGRDGDGRDGDGRDGDGRDGDGRDGDHADAATVPVRRSTRELGRRADDRIGSRALRADRGDSRLFTGTMGAVARAQAFSGPGADVIHERERTAERDRTPPPDPVRDDATGVRRSGVPRDDGHQG